MCLSKNKVLIIVLLLAITLLIGCKKNMPNEILPQDIYLQEEDEYLIYFYKAKCPYCEKCEETIKQYIENEEEQTIKLYTCNLTKAEIKRYYKGENGQGSKGQYYVNGVSDYTELYIAGVPSLIKIKKVNEVKESEYLVSGASKVLEYINALNKKDNM